MPSNELVQRVGAKAVILSDGGILVMHPSDVDANRKWHIPGGIRDDIDEPLEETAKREVREETGIDLTGVPCKVLRIGEWPAVDKGEHVKILAVFYLFELPSRPKIVLSDEHDNSAWINLENHQEYEANPEVHQIVESMFGTAS